jgi:tRNA dimethylallyltransferase
MGDLQAEIVRATKRFARRQDSWFRADPRVQWVDAGTSESGTRVVTRLEAPDRAG